MVTLSVMVGNSEVGEMVQTSVVSLQLESVVGMLNLMMSSVGAALASRIACLREPVLELLVLVTVNSAAWAGLAMSRLKTKSAASARSVLVTSPSAISLQLILI